MSLVTTLYEPTHTDGYRSTGTGKFYTSEAVATAIAKKDHGSYGSTPHAHAAIPVEGQEGMFYLLKHEEPVALADSDAAKQQIVAAVLAKLSKEEREVLGYHDAYHTLKEAQQ